MKIKKGDLVKVITGSSSDKGKTGKVLEVYPKTGRVKVEGIATVKKHVKPQRDPKNPDGGIVEKLSTIHISNVMYMSESQSRPVRIGFEVNKSGQKSRIAKGKNVEKETF